MGNANGLLLAPIRPEPRGDPGPADWTRMEQKFDLVIRSLGDRRRMGRNKSRWEKLKGRVNRVITDRRARQRR